MPGAEPGTVARANIADMNPHLNIEGVVVGVPGAAGSRAANLPTQLK